LANGIILQLLVGRHMTTSWQCQRAQAAARNINTMPCYLPAQLAVPVVDEVGCLLPQRLPAADVSCPWNVNTSRCIIAAVQCLQELPAGGLIFKL